MRFGYSEECLDHDTGDRHPESPARIRAIRQALVRKEGVTFHEAARATLKTIEAVHDPDYVQDLQEFCADGGGRWDPDTVAVEETWQAALRSVGLATWAAHKVSHGQAETDIPFSLGRPPGHHAITDDAMGFCFFNNIAIAAQAVLAAGDAERVAIFDWDVHHGNGTQELFYDRDDVLYASIHEEGLYPGTGDKVETGEGVGEGTTVNVPLQAGAGDVAYGIAYDDVIAPAIQRFDPDLFLVSAGFDAHERDPISRMGVSTEGYAYLARRVHDVAEQSGAGVGFVLEGGYSLDVLAEGVGTVHEVFQGREPMYPEGELDDDIATRVDSIVTQHDL